MKELLRDLVALPGCGAFEQPVGRYIAERAGRRADGVQTDGLGNVIAWKQGGRPGPTVMLSAHMDEVGFMVQSITARDCPPVASTVRIFMPKPINMMEYCKIFLLQNVIPASMADGRFQNARIIPNKIANTGPPISFPTVGI